MAKFMIRFYTNRSMYSVTKEFSDLNQAIRWTEEAIGIFDPHFIVCDNDSFVRSREVESFRIINLGEVI